MVSSEVVKSAPAFYVLSDPLVHGAFRGTTDDLSYADMLAASRGEHSPKFRPLVKQNMGHKLLDFVWVSLVPLMSNRVVEALSASGATGWCTYEADLHRHNGQKLSGYHGLGVIGRCESFFLDANHSELVYVEYPKGLGPKYRGLWFDIGTWDGSDVFTCSDNLTTYTIVTDKVKSVLVRERITNVRLRHLSEVEVDATDQPMIFNPEEQK